MLPITIYTHKQETWNGKLKVAVWLGIQQLLNAQDVHRKRDLFTHYRLLGPNEKASNLACFRQGKRYSSADYLVCIASNSLLFSITLLLSCSLVQGLLFYIYHFNLGDSPPRVIFWIQLLLSFCSDHVY